MSVILISRDSARGSSGLLPLLCRLESGWLISLCTPNNGLKCWLCHMSRLFTALEEICPPSSARRAVLFYWLSLERQRNSSTFWVLELRPFHARKGNCVRANSQNICLLFIVMYCVSWFSQSCLKSLFPQTVYWLLHTGLSIECLLCPLSHGELWQWNRWVRRVTWFRGSHDFCGFLQISAVFIEPCWSTLSKTHSNPHIHYVRLFY